MKILYALAFSLILFLGSCSEDGDMPLIPDPDGDNLIISEAFPLLSFTRPVDLQSNGDNHLFVVEQPGTIRVFVNDPTVDKTDIFLDFTAEVDDRDNEEGLLGLAFHPNFNQNGYFYINYTSSQSTTRVSRFSANSQNSLQADPTSELVLIEFSQPFGNHNGGQLVFGPDGYLYIAVGDGGSGGDPQGHGQNTSSLLGSILRIDVDNPSDGLNYGIPNDNYFAGNQSNHRAEIYAFGLRNPWRMSFDSESGQLWVADVGQNEFEEIDIVENGGNYGWKIMEADDCFNSNNCDQTNLTGPYFQYSHDNGNVSITGGFVYRGIINDLKGWYIYADYASGRVWALETAAANPTNKLLFDTNHRISTFGIDSNQEVYFCSIAGKIYKLELAD